MVYLEKQPVYYYHTAFDIKPDKVVVNVDIDVNGKRFINSTSMKPSMFPLPGNYFKKRVTTNTYFFGGTGVIITPVKCKLAKLCFHTSELGFKDNLWFIIDSLDIATQRSRSYSYAGNKLAYQVLSPNLYFHFGVIIRITTRTSRSQ